MFISVKDAADLTGKSATTIYRLCNKRINTEYVRKEDNKFLIDKEFLMATYPQEEAEEQPEFTEELPEMRFANVIEEEETDNTVEEKVVVLEKSNVLNDNVLATHENEIETGATVEFEEQKKTYFQLLTSRDVIIGITTSLMIIALFIYLLSRFSN